MHVVTWEYITCFLCQKFKDKRSHESQKKLGTWTFKQCYNSWDFGRFLEMTKYSCTVTTWKLNVPCGFLNYIFICFHLNQLYPEANAGKTRGMKVPKCEANIMTTYIQDLELWELMLAHLEFYLALVQVFWFSEPSLLDNISFILLGIDSL